MRIYFLVFIAFALSSRCLEADSVSFTVTPAAGQYLYQFTLSNTGDTGGTLFDLFLSIPTDISKIDTTSIGTPVGWGDPTGGLLFFGPDANPSTSFIEWADDASGAFDLSIGNSLTGFSFQVSQIVAGPIDFALNGSTTLFPAEEVSSVPEPSFVGLLLALFALIVVWRTRVASTR